MKPLLRFCCLIALLLPATGAWAQPAADFTATITSGCAPLTVYFSDASTGTITNYNWNLGNGVTPTTTSSATPVSTTYNTPGNYTVQLQVVGPGGTNTAIKTAYIKVYSNPTVNFTATLNPASGCLPAIVQFSPSVTLNSPGSATYTWDFDDGSPTTNAVSPVHTYTTTGPFSVTLTVENGAELGCATTTNKPAFITTYTRPIAQFTADSDYFCGFPGTIKFTNTSTGGPFSSTVWRFGDGGNGSGSPVTHSYLGGGPSYNVTMIATDTHGCKDSTTGNNFINAYTTQASFSSSNAVCQGSAITFFNTTPGNVTSSHWEFGDGSSDDGNSVGHIYDTPGTKTVRLITSIGPCIKTVTHTIIVNPKPVSGISFSPSVPCPPPSGVTFVATNSNIAHPHFNWNFGNGDTALMRMTATDTFRTSGYKTVVLTTIDSVTGCRADTAVDTVPIRLISVEISAEPVAGCIPLGVTFAANIYGSLPPPAPPGHWPPYPVGISTYNWNFSGGTVASSNLPNPVDSFKNIGNYTVTLTGLSANGCAYTGVPVFQPPYIKADGPVPPTFYAMPDSICVKTPVTFYNTTPVVAGTTYTWNLADTSLAYNNSTFKSSITYSYAKSGVKTISLSANHNGCDSTLSKTAYIFVRPSDADFVSLIDCPLKNQSSYKVFFTDISNGSTSRDWDFGDGSPHDTAANPTHIYTAVGTYKVKLTTYSNIFNCGDNKTASVTVYDPALSISASDSTICKGDQITLSGSFSGAAASYSWIFDNDPATQTPFIGDNHLNYVFNTGGAHAVKLISVSGNGCYDTLLIPDFIKVSDPQVKFGAAQAIGCAPLIVNLRDSTVPTKGTGSITKQWDWDFGDFSAHDTTQNPTHTYGLGVYDVTLSIIDSFGCTGTLTKLRFIESRHPAAFFTAINTRPCVGDSVVFTNTSTGVTALTYLWMFGDGTTSTAQFPKHAYTKAGVYDVRLAVFDASNCSDTAVRIGYITAVAPHAAFTMDKTVSACPPLVVKFSNTSTGATAITYSWFFEPGSALSSIDTPTHTFAKSGIFNVVLTVTDADGCKDRDTGTVYVLGYAGAFTITPTNTCVGAPVQFSANVTNVPKITWDFNDGTAFDTSNSFTVTHIYTTPNTYAPVAIFSDGNPNCRSVSSASVPVKVDKVSASFTATVPCVDSPFTLNSTSTAVFSQPDSWQWFFAANDTTHGAVTSHSFNTSGTHPVKLIATNAWGCADTLTKDVFINALPIVDAGPADTGICPGDTARLIAHGALTYVWSSPTAGVICPTCDTAYLYTAGPTKYYLIGKDTNGCVNRDSITASIQIKTTSSVSKGGDICIGETFRLYAAGATVYSWSPVRFLDSPNIAAPLATPIITTAYVVAAQEGTCLVRYDTVIVNVHPKPEFLAGYEEIINYGASTVLQPSRTGIASIAWRPDSTLSCWDCFRPVAHPSYTTTYYARVLSEWGCADSGSVRIRVRCNGDSVFIPNTFTPNDDGLNEVFYPRGKGITGMRNVRIFNRWGEMVFERFDIALNDEAAGWDGTYKGRTLPPDVYVYTMQTRCESGELVEWKGDVTLVR